MTERPRAEKTPDGDTLSSEKVYPLERLVDATYPPDSWMNKLYKERTKRAAFYSHLYHAVPYSETMGLTCVYKHCTRTHLYVDWLLRWSFPCPDSILHFASRRYHRNEASLWSGEEAWDLEQAVCTLFGQTHVAAAWQRRYECAKPANSWAALEFTVPSDFAQEPEDTHEKDRAFRSSPEFKAMRGAIAAGKILTHANILNDDSIMIVPSSAVQWAASRGVPIHHHLRGLLDTPRAVAAEHGANVPEDTSEWITNAEAIATLKHALQALSTYPVATDACRKRIRIACEKRKLKHIGEGRSRRIHPDSLNTFIRECEEKTRKKLDDED